MFIHIKIVHVYTYFDKKIINFSFFKISEGMMFKLNYNKVVFL
jgi:hypothetical protein